MLNESAQLPLMLQSSLQWQSMLSFVIAGQTLHVLFCVPLYVLHVPVIPFGTPGGVFVAVLQGQHLEVCVPG